MGDESYDGGAQPGPEPGPHPGPAPGATAGGNPPIHATFTYSYSNPGRAEVYDNYVQPPTLVYGQNMQSGGSTGALSFFSDGFGSGKALSVRYADGGAGGLQTVHDISDGGTYDIG